MSASFWSLLSVPFILVLSNSLLIPILPQVQKELGISLFQSGLIITAFSLTAGLVIPLAGYLSDHIGRKSVMIPALFVFGLGGLAAGLASLLLDQPYRWILAARVLQGVGGGGTYQLALALAGDMFSGKKRSRAVSYLEAANGFGKVVAPLLGSLVALIIWYAPFFVYPTLAWSAAVLIWIACQAPELAPAPTGQEYLSELYDTWKQRGRGLSVCFAVGFAALFLLFGLLSYFADVLEQNLHVEGFTRGLFVAIPVLCLTITCSLIAAYIENKPGSTVKAALVTGLILVAVALFALAPLSEGYIYLAPLIMAAVGTGIFLPVINLLITSSCKSERGLVTALYGTVRFFGAALGPPAVGLGVGWNKKLLFVVFGLFTAVLSGGAWWAVDPAAMLPSKILKDASTEPASGDAGQDR